MDSHPSMRHIAERLGVSTMTVSRALRNHPEVSQTTRDKILAEAHAMGYVKNPLVSALMEQRRGKQATPQGLTIAHIHCLPFGRRIQRNLLNLRDGINSQAQSHGFQVNEFYLNEPGMTPKRLVEILRHRGIRAAIFEHFFEYDVSVDIDLSGISAIAITHTMRKPALNRIVVGEYYSVVIAVEELRKRGYQRIGLSVNARQEEIARVKRRAAWLLYQSDLPSPQRIPVLSEPREHYDSAFRTWFKRYRPDAIISPYGRTLRLLQELKAPETGFVRLGWNDEDSHMAGVDPDWRHVGVTAANQVINQLYRNEFGEPQRPTVTSIEGRWVNGPTVRQAQ